MADKKTIGIVRDCAAALEALQESGNFDSELDAAKFAMAHAIKCGVARGTVEGADTKWNVGSVDPGGELRGLLSAFYPEVEEPYRLLEYLINRGLEQLAEEAQSPDVYGKLFSV